MLAQPLLVAQIALAEIVPKHYGSKPEENMKDDTLYGKGLAERFCFLAFMAANEEPLVASFLDALMQYTPQGLAIGQKYLSKLGTSADPVQEMYKMCDTPAADANAKTKIFCAVRPQLNWITSSDWWFGRGYDTVETVRVKLSDIMSDTTLWMHINALTATDPKGNPAINSADCATCGIKMFHGEPFMNEEDWRWGDDHPPLPILKPTKMTSTERKAYMKCRQLNTRQCRMNWESCAYDTRGKCVSVLEYYGRSHIDNCENGCEHLNTCDFESAGKCRDNYVMHNTREFSITCQDPVETVNKAGKRVRVSLNKADLQQDEFIYKLSTSTGRQEVICSKDSDKKKCNFGCFEKAQWGTEDYGGYDVYDFFGERDNFWNHNKDVRRDGYILETLLPDDEIRKLLQFVPLYDDAHGGVNMTVNYEPLESPIGMKDWYERSEPTPDFLKYIFYVKRNDKSYDHILVNMSLDYDMNFPSTWVTTSRRIRISPTCLEEYCEAINADDRLFLLAYRLNWNAHTTFNITRRRKVMKCGRDAVNAAEVGIKPTANKKARQRKQQQDAIDGMNKKSTNMAKKFNSKLKDKISARKLATKKSKAKVKVLSKLFGKGVSKGAGQSDFDDGEDVEKLLLGVRGAVADVFGKGASYLYFKWWPNFYGARKAMNGQNRFFWDSAIHAGPGVRYSTSGNFDYPMDNDDKLQYEGAVDVAPAFLYHQFSFGIDQNFKKMFSAPMKCVKHIVKTINGLVQLTSQALIKAKSDAAAANCDDRIPPNYDKNHIKDVIMGGLSAVFSCALDKPMDDVKTRRDAHKKKWKNGFSEMLKKAEVEVSMSFGVQHPRCFQFLLDVRGSKFGSGQTWKPQFESFKSCTGDKLSSVVDAEEDDGFGG